MNFINNLKVKSKLMFMISIPLLGLIIFSILLSKSYYEVYLNMSKLKDVTVLSTKISSLVHEIQKERGLTAGYLNSHGKKLKNQLEKQKKLTDIKMNEYNVYLNSIDTTDYSNEFLNTISLANNNLNKINTMRNNIFSLKIKLNKALTFYTNTNIKFLNITLGISEFSDNALFSRQINSYSSFLFAKDNTGIERAVGAVTFANDRFLEGMRTKLTSLIAKQKAYLELFFKNANKEVRDYYNKTISGDLIKEVNKIQITALEANNIGGFNVDSTYWFNNITSKINKLKEVENYISSKIQVEEPYLKDIIILAKTLSNTLHETQKERGATAGYLGSKGKKFKESLPSQRVNTDLEVLHLNKVLKSIKLENYPIIIQDNVKNSMLMLKQTLGLRNKIDQLNIEAKDAISSFTNMNAQFLQTISVIATLPKDATTSSTLITFYNFLMSKERAGIERAIMSNVFASNKFTGNSKNKFTTLVIEQNTFNKSFLATANQEVKDFYKSKIRGKDIDNVNKMREIAFNANTIGGFGVESEYWFKKISSKINLLKKVEDFQADMLIKEANEISKKAYNNLIIVLISAIILIVICLILGINIANKIIKSLGEFQSGLKNFFSFLNYEKENVELINNHYSDEFGQMTESVNQNINKTKNNILEDRELINETISISNRINKGYLDGKISSNSANPALNELKDILNSTISGLDNNMQKIEEVLISYSNQNYIPTIANNGMEGVIAKLIEDINKLGETITKTLIINKRNGLILETGSNVLLKNVDSLNRTSNEAAAALEETAAALEEITSTIISNTTNLSTMTQYADKVTSSSKSGEVLANNTMKAMDGINEQVASITDAISVIDQIAFQTNILSLNAAVEAATAGEAGKGFAVVAQEVRNLAARSSESAKEIKDIVEDATQRANEGKKTATFMLEGYKELNSNIEKTIALMHDVNSSSKEQQTGIEQINDAVTQIDQQTQLNASSAAETQGITIQTQKLAASIVAEANKKEFRGKNEVIDKRATFVNKEYEGEDRRS